MTTTPNTVGPYRVLDVLGRGGMGVVYRAEHRETGARVALKTIAIHNEQILASVRREIHALARIHHPGVVRIVDEGVAGGVPWYAMEIVAGVTLREHASELGDDLGAVLGVVRGLCEALAFLHGEGLVHRDLKPDNVLVVPPATPVIVDFGLAARFGGPVSREELGLAPDGFGTGTIAYVAPEQLLGDSVDARADLYSLGCLLYELLTGDPPFTGTSAFQVIQAHLGEVPPPPSARAPRAISRELDALVLRLLAKDPGARLGYADDVTAALARLGAGEGPAREAPRPRPYLYRARFAGRAEALGVTSLHLSQLERERGGVLFVGGESGVGKTRLVLQMARGAQEANIRVLSGECAPPLTDDDERGAGATPFQALRRPLEQIADRCRDRGPGTTARIVGARAGVLALYEPAFADLPGQPAPPAPEALPAEAARLRLFTCLRDTLLALAGDAPLLVLLDDLQWADELTLGFLEYLVHGRFFEDAPALVVGTYRLEEAGRNLRALVESPGSSLLALGRLDEAAVGSIVGDMLALAPPPPLLSHFLARQSEGNPFFVAEYLRAAVEEDVLWRNDEGAWEVVAAGSTATEADYERLGFPAELRDLVARRLRGLPRNPAEAVAAAAVLGREATLSVLARVSGLAEDDFADALGELLRRHVLEEAAPGLLRFAHDKIREMAYDGLATPKRVELHGAAARAIETIEGAAAPALLGHHWARAGERGRAGAYYLVAARDAKSRYANREAARLYRAYLDLVDAAAEPAETVRARNELAVDILSPLGRTAEALEEVERALADVRSFEDARAHAECWRSLGVVFWETGRLDDAIGAYERALALAREVGDRQFEARTLVSLGNGYLHKGRRETARTHYERALVIDRETGNRQHEGVALGNLGIVSFDGGEPDEAFALYGRALALAREVGDRRSEGRHLGNLALLCSSQRRFEEGSAYYERALAVAREIGDLREEGIILGNLSDANIGLARFEEAREQYLRSLAIHREIGNRRFETFVMIASSSLERYAGRLDEAEALLARAEPSLAEFGDKKLNVEWWCKRGHLLLARGAPADTAIDEARKALGAADPGIGSELRVMVDRLARAHSAFESGGALGAGELLEDLPAPVRRRLDGSGSRGDRVEREP